MAEHLLVNAFISVALFVLLWLASLPRRDPSFVDAWWAFGIVVLAWLSFAQAHEPGAHALALASLATGWGARLGFYLLWRWRKHGRDRRYAKMMENAKRDHGWNYPRASLILVFALQMPMQFVVALPAQLGVLAPAAPFGVFGWLGGLIALAGIAMEATADAQLASFKADPANDGKVMDRGLWRYSRHPNHFGDACLWWGLWLIAAETGEWLWTLPGPILLTFLVTRVSGAPTIEPYMRRERPDYEAYVRRTSAFVPWPPRMP